MTTALEYLEKLVSFETVSCTGEADRPNVPLIDFAEERLSALGFETHRIPVKPGKAVLLATRGPRGGLMLSGHTDTGGRDPKLWRTDPHRLHVEGGRAYGLGACDMKGFLACAMAFAENLPAEPSRGFSILMTCDEESTMDGARAASTELVGLGMKPELIVIGEPTLLTPVFGHKGYLARDLIIEGKSAHSSDPSAGINAVKLAAPAIGMLNALELELARSIDPGFGTPGSSVVPYPTLNIGSIHGGDSVNRVCPSVKITFDVRPMPKMDLAAVIEKLEKLEARLNALCDGKAHIRAYEGDLEPFENPDPAVRRALEAIAGKPGEFVNYCTEASFLKAVGPTVVMGPGSIAVAHSVDEYVEVAQLEGCMELIGKLFAAYAV